MCVDVIIQTVTVFYYKQCVCESENIYYQVATQ